MSEQTGVVEALLALPVFESEWVLWLLFGLSIATLGLIAERAYYFRRHRVGSPRLRDRFHKHLGQGDYRRAAATLAEHRGLDSSVALAGLREHDMGVESVEELLTGAMSREQQRFKRGLSFLATVGSNAPFIGLFGTVLGIIKSFGQLSTGAAAASGAVMSGISEALVATAVGLMVAIPALIAYNAFAGGLKRRVSAADDLSHVLLAHLKRDVAEES